jgi:putative tricarboxylic transport membrane protein
MWVGNLMLVILNLPLIGIWIKLLTVPYRLLYPVDHACSAAIGVYTHATTRVRRLHDGRSFGLLGYMFDKLELRAGAAAAGLHPRADDGREPAPRDAALARRLERVR